MNNQTNQHCQSCLAAHWKKMTVCVLTLADLILAARQVGFIRESPSENDEWMIAIVLARALITWTVFAIAVTTLNHVVACHTEKGAVLKGNLNANI